MLEEKKQVIDCTGTRIQIELARIIELLQTVVKYVPKKGEQDENSN